MAPFHKGNIYTAMDIQVQEKNANQTFADNVILSLITMRLNAHTNEMDVSVYF